MKPETRVLVAMSGGVDSSVALLKVLEEGYEAVGVTMKLMEYSTNSGTRPAHSYCCSVDAINNAKLVCQTVGVPHYTLDYQDVFRENVVNYLVEEYFSGRTPNPCIRCNIYLRWGALTGHADLLNAHWIATGHYARIDRTDPKRPVIRKGADPKKDQSYVLWGIPVETLNRTLFPLGSLTKQEVRKLAKDAGLVTADMAESQEICFIPNDNYRDFLYEYAPGRSEREEAGEFVSVDGSIMGNHKGISQYTIGQRRGLGISGPEPVYVRDIDPETKKITLSPRREMFFDGCTIENLNLFKDPGKIKNGGPIQVQIRYNHKGVPCRISTSGNGTIKAEFESPQFAVTPGQSAVFYRGDVLLGGGIIKKGFTHD